jgi:hypothetical protein
MIFVGTYEFIALAPDDGSFAASIKLDTLWSEKCEQTTKRADFYAFIE